MLSRSRMSPVTGSTSISAMLGRLAGGGISTFTFRPRASSARATAEPTKPDAPVTSAVSVTRHLPACAECRSPLDTLPIEQRRNAQHDFTGAFEQRHRQPHLGGQPE